MILGSFRNRPTVTLFPTEAMLRDTLRTYRSRIVRCAPCTVRDHLGRIVPGYAITVYDN